MSQYQGTTTNNYSTSHQTPFTPQTAAATTAPATTTTTPATTGTGQKLGAVANNAKVKTQNMGQRIKAIFLRCMPFLNRNKNAAVTNGNGSVVAPTAPTAPTTPSTWNAPNPSSVPATNPVPTGRAW